MDLDNPLLVAQALFLLKFWYVLGNVNIDNMSIAELK